ASNIPPLVQLPQPDFAILVARRQHTAIRTKGETCHLDIVSMRAERSHLLRVEIPESDVSTSSSCGQPIGARTKRENLRCRVVCADTTCPQIPDPQRGSVHGANDPAVQPVTDSVTRAPLRMPGNAGEHTSSGQLEPLHPLVSRVACDHSHSQ